MQTPEFDALEEAVLAAAHQVYSKKTVDHAMNPRNVGEIVDADGYGCAFGHCGDSIEIWLLIRNDTVFQARFWTDGCAATIASGSVVTELVYGRQIEQIRGITQEDVLKALDGLPENHQHCATLAANAVKESVKDYLRNKREPWKKVYRNT